MNIELTALEAGSLVVFSIAVTGIVMALRKRVVRNKNKEWHKEKTKIVEKTEFKTNTETPSPSGLVKNQSQSEQVDTKDTSQSEQVDTKDTSQPEPIDTDALLKDLKKDSDKE